MIDDTHFMTLLKGKRIKLTLKTSSFSGVVLRINPNKTLVLAEVSGSDGCKYVGPKLFFGREILNVEFAKEENNDRKITSDVCEEQLDVEKFQPYRKFMNLYDDEEEERINFVVIDEMHEKFGPAVMHIKKQHVIGVGGEGVGIFKNGRLCWLEISTKNKVYLFDILLLGTMAFKNGLSMILESKQILKVIHDCRVFSGNLFAQFGVKLTNVFDTQVADVMCFYSKTGGLLPDRVSTLQEVVSLHLNVPSSRLSPLHVRSQLTKEEMEMWHKRPCPVPLLKVMALSVIHLTPLRLVLLDTLMTDYMVLVDSYLSSSLYEPDGLEHVTMEDALDLPKELRQLDTMRSERQESARKRYPVTEKGLLARFSPYSSSETKPANGYSDTWWDSLEAGAAASFPSTKMNPPDTQQIPSVSSLAAPSKPQADPFNPQPELAKNTPPTASLNKESNLVQVDIMGRGSQLRNEQSSVPVLPSIGRGFLQKPQPQIPAEGAGGMKRPGRQEMSLGAAGCEFTSPDCSDDEHPKHTSGMGEQPAPCHPSFSSLLQSFRSFRS